MTDATALRLGLSDYVTAMRRQIETLREHHAQLEGALGPLMEHYKGRGAERFLEVFGAVDVQFKAYLEHGGDVLSVLTTKLNDLDRFDTGGDL